MPASARGEDSATPVAAVSSTMRLLLAAALLPRDQAAEAWRSWLAAVDFEDLEDGATALLGLVARNLPELHAGDAIDGRVRGVQRQTWAGNQVLWSAVRPLVDRLGTVAGPPLLLPPTALVPAFDGAWGARPWHRIELALHAEAVAGVRSALASTGWPVDHLTPRLLAWTRAGLVGRWQATDAAGNWVSIRWQLLRGIGSQVADEQLRGAALSTTVGSARVHLLHPADALVERLWNAPDDLGPGWIVEVVALARRLEVAQPELGVDPNAGPARFASRARSLGLSGVLRERLDVVADVLDDPAVSSARAALDRTRRGAVEALWSLPGPVAGVGRTWAGHAAGQGLVGGARSVLRVRRAVAQVR